MRKTGFGIEWLQRLLCAACLLATPAAALGETGVSSESKIALKRKVAIARFSNETKAQLSFLVDESNDRIGKQASDILSARLAQTNNFLLFERQDSDEVSAEKIIAGLQEQGVAVDYLILGSVSEFGRSTTSQSGVFQRAKIQRAFAKVNVRLVEVSTGRIVFASEGAGESETKAKKTLGVGSSAGFDQTLSDKAISAAISQVVSKLAETMTEKPWRSYLLAKEGDQYLMSGGEHQGIQVGTQFAIYREGRTVKNPQTGTTIELPGRKIANAVVTQSFGADEFSEISFLKISNGQINEALENYYVLEK